MILQNNQITGILRAHKNHPEDKPWVVLYVFLAKNESLCVR